MHDIIKLGRFLSRGASCVPCEGKFVSKQDFNLGSRYTMVLTNALRFDAHYFYWHFWGALFGPSWVYEVLVLTLHLVW